MTTFEYDAAGRLIKVIDPLEQGTSYTYDERGHKLSETDAKGHTTTWGYDEMGRMIRHTLPLGMSEHFTYDERGNRETRTDFGGRVTEYDYDVEYNRLTTVTYEDGSTIEYTYTDPGRRESVTLRSLGEGGQTQFPLSSDKRRAPSAVPMPPKNQPQTQNKAKANPISSLRRNSAKKLQYMGVGIRLSGNGEGRKRIWKL